MLTTNPTAPILRCQHSLITIGAFDLERVLEFDPFFLGEFKQPRHDKAVSSLQSVGHMFNGSFKGEWQNDEERRSSFVFIGKNLELDLLKNGFEACRVAKELRFSVGTKVEANLDDNYVPGTILEHWVDGNAYLIELEDGEKVCAPVDIDEYVRGTSNY